MEDRSLDDFLDAGSDDAEESAASDPSAEDASDVDATESDVDAPESASETTAEADDSPGVDADVVEPAVSTYVWSGEGGECAACGATVDRRWRQDDDLVCVECKEW